MPMRPWPRSASALRANAGLTEHALEELQEAIQAREQELKVVEKQQTDLAEATPQAPELLLPDLERRQGELEPKEDRALEDARALLEAARPKAEHPAEPIEAQAEAAQEHAAAKATSGVEAAEQGHEGRRADLGARQHERLEELGTVREALDHGEPGTRAGPRAVPSEQVW